MATKKPVKKMDGGMMAAAPARGMGRGRGMGPRGAMPEGGARPMPPQGGRGMRRGAPVAAPAAAPAMKKGGAVKKSSDKMGRAVSRKTADVKGRAMKKGC